MCSPHLNQRGIPINQQLMYLSVTLIFPKQHLKEAQVAGEVRGKEPVTLVKGYLVQGDAVMNCTSGESCVR